MTNVKEIAFTNYKSLAICVAFVCLLHFHQVSSIESDSESSEGIDLHCKYQTLHDKYQCRLQYLNIGTEHVNVASFTGSHVNGKTDEDVTSILFSDNTMPYFPNGVGAIFKNLENLYVFDKLSTKDIERSYFQNMKKLVDVRFVGTEIEVLPFNTLWDLPALKTFYFTNNKLHVLDERTFEKNEKLTDISLMSNRLEFLPGNLFKNNLLLENVYFSRNSLKNIAIDFTLFKNIQGVYLSDNACIDGSYVIFDSFDFSDNYERLTEFQSQIRANCSSSN